MRYEEYWASKMRKKCSNLIAEKGPVLQSRYLGLPLSEFIQKCKTFHQSTAGVTLGLVMLKQFNIITSCLSLSVDFSFFFYHLRVSPSTAVSYATFQSGGKKRITFNFFTVKNEWILRPESCYVTLSNGKFPVSLFVVVCCFPQHYSSQNKQYFKPRMECRENVLRFSRHSLDFRV